MRARVGDVNRRATLALRQPAGSGVSEVNTYNALGQLASRVTAGFNDNMVYDPAGQWVGQYNSSGGYWWSEYIRLGGRVVAFNSQSEGKTVFLHKDLENTTHMVTGPTGSIIQDQVFYPWGQSWHSLGTWFQQEFAGLDFFDPQSSLYHSLSRYYNPAPGRWMSPDPGGLKVVTPEDPQTWNMYAYARNNPTTFVDPEGKAIELTCSSDDDDACAAERQKELDALKNAVGAQAGAYLYDNVDKNGNHYVGIYTNGPNGNGPAFESINDVSSAVGGIINDTRVAQLEVVAPGTMVTADDGSKVEINTVNKNTNTTPGLTYTAPDGSLHVAVLDWTKAQLGSLPGDLMSDKQPGFLNPGIVTGHEFGHVQYGWSTGWAHFFGSSNGFAVRIEDKIREQIDPNGPKRESH